MASFPPPTYPTSLSPFVKPSTKEIAEEMAEEVESEHRMGKRGRGDSECSEGPLAETLSRKRHKADMDSARHIGGDDISVDIPSEGKLRLRWKRDETYYMEDGSCVLLVGDTLFNVHRSILSKDASSFGTMFTLPQGNHPAEGTSDDNPIMLAGDKPSEFRHFLWALYALPPELRLVTSPSANLPQLIDIALIANKYSFKSIETWALDAIQEYVNRKPSPLLVPPAFTSTPSPAASFFSLNQPSGGAITPSAESTAQLTRLIRLAQLCAHERLLSTMITLLRTLMASSVQYAYLAMSLADELDLRALRGAAYLEVMQKATVVTGATVDLSLKPKTLKPQALVDTNADADEDEDAAAGATAQEAGEGTLDASGRLIVTRAQQLRLLAGHYRLAGAWESLRRTPPHFEHAPSCGATWHMQGCRQSWLEFWKEKTRSDAVLAFGLADVLGRLRQVQKEHDRWGSATYMHHDCRMAARRSIAEVIRKVEEGLPDFFSEAGECDG